MKVEIYEIKLIKRHLEKIHIKYPSAINNICYKNTCIRKIYSE